MHTELNFIRIVYYLIITIILLIKMCYHLSEKKKLYQNICFGYNIGKYVII